MPDSRLSRHGHALNFRELLAQGKSITRRAYVLRWRLRSRRTRQNDGAVGEGEHLGLLM